MNELINQEELYDIWRDIAISNLEWSDVDDRFADLQPGVANILCPFHDNRHSPSARPYWDEDRDILVIHCFREKKTFTVFDYINLILCNQQKRYKDPGDYLVRYFGQDKYNELYKLAKDKALKIGESKVEQKKEYIKNLYSEHNNVVGFINALYLEQ